MNVDPEVSVRIAELNDNFRRHGRQYTYTAGVIALGGDDLAEIMEAVASFNKFGENNDPYGEHDFGTVVWRSHKIFWKIDYYDAATKYYKDPLAPTCWRVLTVMLAEEY